MCAGFIEAATKIGKTVLKKDGRRAVLRSQVIELNGGARNIATIATGETTRWDASLLAVS